MSQQPARMLPAVIRSLTHIDRGHHRVVVPFARDPVPAMQLVAKCVRLSRWFTQDGTSVLDIGCSTGSLLRSIRKTNQSARPSISYTGIDIEPAFLGHWRKWHASNVHFEVCDARSFVGFENLSLVCSLFTMQFIPE